MTPPLQEGDQIDRYTVLRPLGEGGMAAVFLVRHNTLKSLHAFKVLTHAGGRIRDRLIQEGQVQASLRHRNIVAVTDVLEVGADIGLLMEFVDGPTLEGWLRENRPTLEQALSIFGGILAGVGKAHRAGVIHRDLKPANVLMATDEGELVPRVADFGLAKAMEDGGGLGQTRTGIAMGTPSYMPPEQIRDAKGVDERGDVFALGCILYEIVCGQLAFPGGDVLEVFNAVASGAFVPPEQIVPGLPPRISMAIRGALDVNRDLRIPDCGTLKRVLAGDQHWAVKGATTTQPMKQASAAPAAETYYPGGAVQERLPEPLTAAEPPEALPLDTLVDALPLGPPSAPTLRSMGGGDLGDLEAVAPRSPPPSEPLAERKRPPWVAALAVTLLGVGTVGALLMGPAGREAAEPVRPETTQPEPTATAPLSVPEEPQAPAVEEPDEAPVTVQEEPAAAPRARTVPPQVEAPEEQEEPVQEVQSSPPESEEEPEPEPLASEPTPPPRRVPMATVTYVGADAIRLVGRRGTFPAGQVPPGRYTVEATFGSVTLKAATLVVRPGETWDLRCDPDFTICRSKKR